MKPRKPLKRGQAPRRKKALPKTRKPISRSGTRLVRSALKRKPSKPRFQRGRDPQYLEWIRGLPCALMGREVFGERTVTNHVCGAPIEAAHVKSRGAGAPDLGAVIPLCRSEHMHQHLIGIKSWATFWFGGLDELRRIAAEVYPDLYEKAKLLGFPGDMGF